MELDLRTVLVILGGLVMLGILVDGFRRMQRSRQDALSIDVKGDFKFPEDSFPSELPNGGARVIGERDAEELLQDAKNFRDQLDSLPVMSALDTLEARAEQALDVDIKDSMHEERIYSGEPDFQHESYAHNETEVVTQTVQVEVPNDVHEDTYGETSSEVKSESFAMGQRDTSERIVPKAKPLNLDEHVPLLMDVEELGDDVAVHENEEFLVSEHVELTMDDVQGIQASVSDIGDLLSEEQAIIADSDEENNSLEEAAEQDVFSLNVGVPEVEEYSSRQQADDMATQAAYAPVKKPGINAEILSNRPVPSLVLVTHVIPHDEDGFCGEDILYLVNSCDLRHGEKGIFHRFEKEGGEGCIEFSMANSFNPGTFDPETLLHERIHGISLFMSLPGPEKAMNAFESMTEMASVIARNLGGDVHDETHSIMALQTIEHNRQQVRDFVRKQKLAGKK
jgi:cell division protein ZipA